MLKKSFLILSLLFASTQFAYADICNSVNCINYITNKNIDNKNQIDEPKWTDLSVFERGQLKFEAQRAREILKKLKSATSSKEEYPFDNKLYVSYNINGAYYRSEDGSIIIGKNLLMSLNDSELAVVLAHELAHALNFDNGRIILIMQDVAKENDVDLELLKTRKITHPKIDQALNRMERAADKASISIALDAGFMPDINFLFDVLASGGAENKSLNGHMDLDTRKDFLVELLSLYKSN